jgi:RHS repeat-associated protein
MKAFLKICGFIAALGACSNVIAYDGPAVPTEFTFSLEGRQTNRIAAKCGFTLGGEGELYQGMTNCCPPLVKYYSLRQTTTAITLDLYYQTESGCSPEALFWTGVLNDNVTERKDRTNCAIACVTKTGTLTATDQVGTEFESQISGSLNCDGWTIIKDGVTNLISDYNSAGAVNDLSLYFKTGLSCHDGYCDNYWWGNYAFTQSSCAAGQGSSIQSCDSTWAYPYLSDGSLENTVSYGEEFTTPQLIAQVQPSGEWMPTGNKSYIVSAEIDPDESAATVNAVEARFKVWARAGEPYTIPYVEFRTIYSNDIPLIVETHTNITGIGADRFDVISVPLPVAFSTFETNGCTRYRGGKAWIEVGGCGDGGCSQCVEAPGTAGAQNNSIHITLGLGGVAYGEGKAFLKIIAARPDPATTTPASLELFGDLRGSAVVRDSNGAIRQVRTPLCLADFTTNSPTSFTIKFYEAASFYGSGPFDTSGATAYSTNTVEQVGSTNHIRLKVENGTTTESEYVWSDSDNGWTLTTGGGLRKESRSVSNSPRVRTHTIKNIGDAVVFQEVSRYVTLGTNYYLSQRETGAPGSGLTNKWFYYDNAGTDGTNYGRIKLAIEPSGFWKRYQYDEHGRLTNEVSQFLNAPTNAAENLCRVVRYNYTSLDGTNDFETRVELLQDIEIGREYTVALPGETRHIRCVTPGASWTNSTNLVTRTRMYGDGEFVGKMQSTVSPDGTMQLFEYVHSSGVRTTTVYSGQPNAELTAIVKGIKTVTVTDESGGEQSKYTYDLDQPSSYYAGGWNEHDDLGRLHRAVAVDGGETYYNYDCCGLESVVDREGVTTTYIHDDLHRQVGTLRNNISITNLLDAAGNVLTTTRVGRDNISQVLRKASYDTAGRLMNETNALGGVTTYTYTFDSSGQTVKTTTYPDTGQRVETYYQDGSLQSVTGSAAFPTYYDYGATNNSSWTKETKGSASGTEWVKSYSDLLGRTWKTEYPGNAVSTNFYNIKGQLEKAVDLDGVTRLYTYNGLGQLDKSILDMDRNGAGADAADRITRTTNDVIVLDELYQRTRTYQTSDDGGEILVRERMISPYQKTIDLSFGQGTTNIIAYPSSQQRTTTTKHPDGSQTVTLYTNGVLASVTRLDSSSNPLSSIHYAYDAHGRQYQMIDGRNGTNTYSYNAADQVQTVTSPSPNGIVSGLVTTTYYDKSLRATNVVHADGTTNHSVYFVNGLLQKTWGSRIYPVEYQYDHAGRMTNMTTWQDFNESTGAGTTGSAATKWLYDTSRGWLNQKKYADNNGPSYTYTAAGRLKSRAWVRGVTTWYTNNNAGELWVINYTDSTADVTNSYDRRGRLTNVLSGTTSLTKIYNDAGHLLREFYSGGPLNGIGVTNVYDHLLRRTNVSTVAASTGYGYDTASRLLTVSDGTNSATYDYLDYSPLVEQIVFATNGTTVMTTTKGYDFLNRLTNTTTLSAGTETLDTHTYVYNTASQRTSVTNVDGSYWVYQYDAMGQVTSGKKYWGDSTPVAGQQFDYTFDDIGNRKTTTRDTRVGTNTVNNLNQYTSRTVPGYVNVLGTATNTATVSLWSKDSTALYTSTTRKGDYFRGEMPFNNATGALWLTITNVAVLSNSASADIVTNIGGSSLLAKTPEAFLYDADGNLTNDSLWAYTWDAENRLVQQESVNSLPTAGKRRLDFTYDHQSRRIQKLVSTHSGSSYVAQSTNRFIYDGWNLLAALSPQAAVIQSFIWGLDLSGSEQGAGGVCGLLAVMDASAINNQPSTHFTAFDGNGNVSVLVAAASGTISAQYEYGPFSEGVRLTGPMAKANKFRFSTKYQDDESDQLYYGYRSYNPASGRWLNRDPLGEPGFRLATGTTRKASPKHEVQVYVFVANSPIVHWDYLGLDNPGCDLPSWLQPTGANAACYRRCCAAHDQCYFSRNGTAPAGNRRCTAASWALNAGEVAGHINGGWGGTLVALACALHPCTGCNNDVLGCFARCASGINPPTGPEWFCPNGPSAGQYFENYDDIPASCWENGVRP